MLQTLGKIEIVEIYLNIVKDIYDKSMANIFLKGEKVKVCFLKTVMRQGCPLLPLLFSIILETVVRANRQTKEIKGI